MRPACVLLWVSVALSVGCATDPSDSSTGGESVAALHSCDQGAELAGAAYDITKSRFAFGSTPIESKEGGLTRWTGSQGVVAIDASGSALAVPNAGAPELTVAGWSSGTETLVDHTRAYFVAMGVAPCQAAKTQALGGSSGIATSLNREVAGIPVVDSTAYAQFNAHDLTTSEGLYWPAVAADIVSAARALHQQLADASMLAAYKAKLPANAQTEGQVVIHHSGAGSTQPFRSVASYDVLVGRSTLSFDASALPLVPPQ
jgi:hypothetical protein